MTAFFATPGETSEWLRSEAVRLDAVVLDELLPGGGRRSFLWPRNEPPLPAPAWGVQVLHPTATATVLSQGETGWKASAFHEQTAATGRRLSRSLTWSLRRRAAEPLFPMSIDGTRIGRKPSAWGTPDALGSGLRFRQFPVAGCWFVTSGVVPRTSPLPPENDRALYEGDGSGRL